MRDDPPTQEHPERRRDHLRLVQAGEQVAATPGRPNRTIGRLIAQTALIAETSLQHRARPSAHGIRGMMTDRLLGRFR